MENTQNTVVYNENLNLFGMNENAVYEYTGRYPIPGARPRSSVVPAPHSTRSYFSHGA